MRWPIAAVALVLTTAVAQAQMTPQQNQINNATRLGKDASQTHPEKSDRPKANDKAYNAALKNLPDKQYDPWHGVR